MSPTFICFFFFQIPPLFLAFFIFFPFFFQIPRLFIFFPFFLSNSSTFFTFFSKFLDLFWPFSFFFLFLFQIPRLFFLFSLKFLALFLASRNRIVIFLSFILFGFFYIFTFIRTTS
ncbi:hypothetical protein RND81_01G021400 [Saponaria officinalis]|uniref:Uncharacterized protein n=1 Tax=Saponaria officinalis TaxID=3572 RepID=A0AAW1NCC7_SAPOF